ncbi:group II intron maturase-specific domain-containing protein [Staphylococcus aureus]
MTRGWINYFGKGFIKRFLKELEPWLNRRITATHTQKMEETKTK